MTNSPITGFSISNFKAFADTQYIPIRPLTLIYGANSSGKSSILHSLLLAHHAITNEGELNVYRTEAGGDSVDLGGFGQYVHKRDRTRLVEWAIDLDPSNINLKAQGMSSLLELTKKLTVGVGIGMHSSGNEGLKVRSFFLEADGERVLNMSSRRKGKLQLDSLDHKHRIVSLLIEAIIEANTFNLKVTPQHEEEIEQVINFLVPEITAQVSRLLPTNIQGETLRQGIPEHTTPLKSQNRQDTLADAIRFYIPHRLNDIVGAITQTVESELEKLQYLGPYRTYPPRNF
ncbi:MAG: AAA family ATPase, partial [Nostocaceae cyanobacterium]|nr:AAA family ATPase [Nostocaceae cyanobacterium]